MGGNLPVTLAPATARGRHRARGFTLLEVVVAVAIAGLALVGLFSAGSGGLLAVDGAARVDEAVERAQSHLAAFGRAGATVAGESEGDDGGGYRWNLRAQPVASQQSDLSGRTAAAMTLFDVEVMISWRAWGHQRSVVLDTRRLGAAVPAP
jgi:general secretion pathway protein I